MDIPLLTQSDHQIQAGVRFGRLLAALGLSQSAAAAELGVSKQRLNNWIKGVAYPDTYMLYRLSKLRGIDFNYVMLGDGSALPLRVVEAMRAANPLQLEDAKAEASQALGTRGTTRCGTF